MDKFNYLGVMISTGGGMQRKWLLGYFREKVAVHMCGFDGVRRDNFFGGEPIRRTEIKSEEA